MTTSNAKYLYVFPYYIRHDYDGSTPVYTFVCEECGDEDSSPTEADARLWPLSHEHSSARRS